MSIARFEMPDGRIARFEVPEGTTPEQAQVMMQAAMEDHPAQEKPQQQAEQQPEQAIEQTQEMSEAGQAILDIPGGAAISEFASAVNRGAINLLDFVSTDQINNVLQLMGSESRVPTLGEQPIVESATTGEFMEPGLARTAVRTAGEFVAPGSVVGQTIRTAAQQIPKVAAQAPTIGQRVTQAMVAKPIPEAATSALAGGGSELGAEAGEFVGGEKGRQVGRLAGGILLPIGAVIAKDSAKLLISTRAKKLLNEAAPTIDGLKDAARGVYKEIDDLGVTINPSSVSKLGQSLGTLVRKEGFDPKSQREVANVLSRFDDVAGQNLPTSEFDIIRKAASNVAMSPKPAEARLGSLMVNKMDDFLDGLNKANFSGAYNKNVAGKYKDARQLWRRVKKSEQLAEAWNKAELSPAGFENGIRAQFRQILKSEKQRKGFTSAELKAMRGVVEGNTIRNMSEKLGMLGIDEKRVSGALMPLMGAAAGSAVDPTGTIIVPLIGTISKKLGLKLAKDAGRGADLVVRAGKNGMDIAKAYMKAVKPKDRTAQELTELLLRPEISLQGLKAAAKNMPMKQKRLINDAAFLVNAIKSTQQEEQ